MNSTLSYFLWIEGTSADLSPDEEMQHYIQECCPEPSEEDLERLYEEVWGDD